MTSDQFHRTHQKSDQVPRNEECEHHIYPQKKRVPAQPPTVESQRQRRQFHNDQTDQRVRRRAQSELHYRVRLLHSMYDENHRRQKI